MHFRTPMNTILIQITVHIFHKRIVQIKKNDVGIILADFLSVSIGFRYVGSEGESGVGYFLDWDVEDAAAGVFGDGEGGAPDYEGWFEGCGI